MRSETRTKIEEVSVAVIFVIFLVAAICVSMDKSSANAGNQVSSATIETATQ